MWRSRERDCLSNGDNHCRDGGALDYVQAWLKINRAAKALFAVGIDKDGYWYMQKKTIRRWNYDIKGPIRLP